MKPQVDLPFDILEHIIDILNEENGPYTDGTLQALSLACKATVALCRKHLFATLYLDDEWGQERSSRFKALISNNPTIIPYIRNIQYAMVVVVPPDDGVHAHAIAILETLGKNQLFGLKSIHLWIAVGPMRRWDMLPGSLRTLLQQLIRLPTVTNLELTGISSIPTNIFDSGNITHITLSGAGFITLSRPDILTEPPQTLFPCRPHSFRVMGYRISDAINFLVRPQAREDAHIPRKIIDLNGLRDMWILIDNTELAHTIWDVIRTCRVLQSFDMISKSIALDNSSG